jgi:hypothetical protein
MTDKELIARALEFLEDNQHHIADHERHAYVMLYNDFITALKERLAQPEPIQSLQCFHCQVTIETLNDKVMHLLAQRTWAGLTDEQKNDCLVSADPCETLAEPEARQLIEDVEQALKERNT